ncbi:penicillin acylase family protein [Cellulomonas edaphi]|uniref:Penicillin acylase family protein n=1 Tax=Cellulomonas edaphi TaxID=3053468 RepID=A0ABT7S4V8_9CELL|nr:penicillin acylase family protein [Cellulomons edaphi]MDM7830640.1 penicillin acylase family protein [Cellulomons edaphi]
MSRRAVRLTVVSVAIVLVVALVAAIVAAVVVIRRPLPQTSGSLKLPGLTAPVLVTRDARGIPTITAKTSADLFRAQGYVAAQDRFFEMDYRRHVTAGRLSELVGENEDALEADKVIRTFGWRRVAQQEWSLIEPETKAALQAYADGVNAYLDGKAPSQIAVEYTVLGLQLDVDAPEKWDPVDSLAWLKAMAWDLRGNYDDELSRARTFASVRDVKKVDALFPTYPEDTNAPILSRADVVEDTTTVASQHPLDLHDADLQKALDAADAALTAVPHLVGQGEGVGSNSWVVGGDHTASGKPILANDPHLSISAPGIWQQIGLRCAQVGTACPYDVSGFSFAGMPGVVIGHNAQLAWGLTNLGADVTDFFLERVNGTVVERDGGTEPMTIRTETIKVNGAEPVEIEVRSTRHGPIISDVIDADAVGDAPLADGSVGRSYAVSLGWTALAPGHTADALLSIDTARDADDIAKVGRLLEVPSQNIVFATTDGHIGYQAPGRIPVRARIPGAVPSDGTWPRPGWDSAYDWQGYVDPTDMPHALDPASGVIVAANQQVTPRGTGPFLTKDWDYGFRSQRILDLLGAAVEDDGTLGVADMATIQLDQHNPYADVLVPTLLSLNIENDFDDDGQDLLRTWDRTNAKDSAAAAYFAAVWADVLRLAFDDDLPDAESPDGGSRWLEVVRELLSKPESPWWDDRSTPGVVEGRDEVLTRAMVNARRQLTAKLGRDPQDWAWGRLHVAAPEHAVLGGDSLPALVRRLVNPQPLQVGGGSSIVDATAWDASSDSYGVTAGPSMRMVVDLGDLDSSTWVNLTGSSGHPASKHYTDQFAAWAHGTTYPWPFSPAAVQADASDHLTFTP